MRWVILVLGGSCALFAMSGNYGCVPKYIVEASRVDEDFTVYQDTQVCTLDDKAGNKYFVFSNKERQDVCSDFR